MVNVREVLVTHIDKKLDRKFALLHNSNTFRDHDALVPVPNEEGEQPPANLFPATTRALDTMPLQNVLGLLLFYNVQADGLNDQECLDHLKTVIGCRLHYSVVWFWDSPHFLLALQTLGFGAQRLTRTLHSPSQDLE